jgi:uncharacterized membrane protein
LLIAVPFDRRRNLLNNKQRLFIGGLFALLVSAIFAIQYLSYTPVGKRSIDSVQGRYFIPFALLPLLLFNSRHFSFSIDQNDFVRRLIIGFIVLAHITSAIILVRRYYPV